MAKGIGPKKLWSVLASLILLAILAALSAISIQDGAQSAAASPAAMLASAKAPPPIKHDIAGRENCLICHNPEGKIKPAPKNHIGRTVDACRACHKPS